MGIAHLKNAHGIISVFLNESDTSVVTSRAVLIKVKIHHFVF